MIFLYPLKAGELHPWVSSTPPKKNSNLFLVPTATAVFTCICSFGFHHLHNAAAALYISFATNTVDQVLLIDFCSLCVVQEK